MKRQLWLSLLLRALRSLARALGQRPARARPSCTCRSSRSRPSRASSRRCRSRSSCPRICPPGACSCTTRSTALPSGARSSSGARAALRGRDPVPRGEHDHRRPPLLHPHPRRRGRRHRLQRHAQRSRIASASTTRASGPTRAAAPDAARIPRIARRGCRAARAPRSSASRARATPIARAARPAAGTASATDDPRRKNWIGLELEQEVGIVATTRRLQRPQPGERGLRLLPADGRRRSTSALRSTRTSRWRVGPRADARAAELRAPALLRYQPGREARLRRSRQRTDAARGRRRSCPTPPSCTPRTGSAPIRSAQRGLRPYALARRRLRHVRRRRSRPNVREDPTQHQRPGRQRSRADARRLQARRRRLRGARAPARSTRSARALGPTPSSASTRCSPSARRSRVSAASALRDGLLKYVRTMSRCAALALLVGLLTGCSADAVEEPEPELETPGAFVARR